jgi:hypothetical protein
MHSMRFKLWRHDISSSTAFTGVVCVIGFFAAVANILTSIYYVTVMPRLPQPVTGRIYQTGAAYNTAVYVSEKEFAWANFVHYDLMSVAGISLVLLAILVLIPKARREGRL